MPIDLARKFKPILIAVLTISDSRRRAEDTSGDILAECVANAGHQLRDRALVKGDVEVIVQRLRQWVADPQIVISTGGTGLTVAT
jgi:molybdenum cofactor biosynthesis protein B